MSERLLVSPSTFLATLSEEMRYSLDNYPILAIKEERVDYHYTKFRLLFTGGYRSITFETDLLNICVKQFLDCVMVFVRDYVDLDNRGINNVKKWIAIIDNLAGIESIQNKFMFFQPILRHPSALQQCPIWFNREFLLHLNRLFDTELIFTNGRQIQFLLRTVKKWMKIMMECGDYEYQVVLVEIIINTCEEHHIDKIFDCATDLPFYLKRMFLKVHSRKDYVNDLEALLSTINNNLHRVRSIPCLNVTLEDMVIPPLKGGGDYTWMHINYGVDTLSFNCDRNSLRSLPGSRSFSNCDEFVTVNFEDINKIGLLINNDCEGVNTVGGIFLMNISGQCSCRLDSSKEMVYSIKKILLKVSEGVHLNFLKNEFYKIFGNRFKQENMRSTKKRNFLEKKNYPLICHNLSFNTENRRKNYMKENASIASSPENLLTQDSKFDNSLTLENKENNGTNDNPATPDLYFENKSEKMKISQTHKTNSSQVACNEQHKSSNVAVAQNKVNILSNIRIAPPLCNKFNQSNNDFQLLNNKYVAAVNELQKLKNELARAHADIAHATQKFQALERKTKDEAELTRNFETNQVCEKMKTSALHNKRKVTGNAEKKRKLTHDVQLSVNEVLTTKALVLKQFIERISNTDGELTQEERDCLLTPFGRRFHIV